MKIDVLLGLQWGDEGKGKIVDVDLVGAAVVYGRVQQNGRVVHAHKRVDDHDSFYV